MDDMLTTEQGLTALRSVAQSTVGHHAALASARAMFGGELRFVDEAVRAAAREGVSPGSDAASHLAASGGKRVRAMALLLSSACFGPVPAAAAELAVVAEMVHAATLLHDDVIDDGDERRGVPTARRVFGNAVSVLAGDLLLTHALDRTARVAPDTLSDLLVTLRRLVDGEVIQLRGRTEIDLSPETYRSIVDGKTASLFGWATRAGARLGGANAALVTRLGTFGEHLGVAFQLVDDVIDYEGDARVTGKSVLSDLREGKVTLPLALAAASDPGIAEDVPRVRTGDVDAATRIARSVARSGACAEVRRLARIETDGALACLDAVPRSPARRLLEGVAVDLTSRMA